MFRLLSFASLFILTGVTTGIAGDFDVTPSVVISHGVETGSRFNSNYQADGSRLPYFAVKPSFNTTTIDVNVPLSHRLRERWSMALSGWHGRAKERQSLYIGSAQTSTASLDGVIQTSSRFSNADLDHRLEAHRSGGKIAFEWTAKFDKGKATESHYRLGAFTEYTVENWDLDIIHTFRSPLPNPANGRQATAWIDEKLRAVRFGATGALRALFKASDHLSLDAELSGAVYLQHSRLSGQDCLPQTFGACDAGHFLAPTGGGAYHGIADDKDTVLGGRTRLSLGVTYDVHDNVSMTFGGYAGAILNSPYIRNSILSDPAPADIRYRTAFEYGVRNTVRVEF